MAVKKRRGRRISWRSLSVNVSELTKASRYRDDSAMGKQMAAAIAWLRSYLALWLVIAFGLVVSWPGWYADARWESIMTNIFATFAVTPMLVFGVDRVLRRAEDQRLRPRQLAAMEELTTELAGCVSSLGAIGNIDRLLPGILAKAEAGFLNTSEVSDENARYLSKFVVTEFLVRHDELEERLSKLELSELVKVMRAAGARSSELRARLVEAGSAVHPELYLRIVKLIRKLQRVASNADLVHYMVDKGYDVNAPGAVALLGISVRQYLDAITDAGNIYQDHASN